MPTHGADEQHARLLSALHEEFLAYGLINTQDASLLRSPSSGGFAQSSAGAFPPLEYLDRQGRKIVVRALAMFDDLIVNTTVSSGSMSAASASSSAAAREGDEDGGGGKGDVVVMLSRRVTFEVPFWLEEQGEADRPQADEATNEYCAGKAEQNQHDQSPPLSCGISSKAPHRGAGRTPSRKELFQARVLSGLLLHLFPPPGQFADLFGVEESLRSRVLGMLGARGLATFGLTSRAAAVSAAADLLWAPLVAAEFSEREQHAVLFLQSSSPSYTEPVASANDGGDSRGDTGSDGDSGGIGSATASNASPSESSTVDEVEKRGVKDHNSCSERSGDGNCGGSDGDGGAELTAGDGIHCSSNSSSSSGSNSNSGGGTGAVYVRGREGASRRLYIKLHEARVRRAAIAAEQRRRSTILEMSALGRLGRAWGLYPWAPYLPRGPHYLHASGPSFPDYNWGPGIGPGSGPGAGSTPDGPDVRGHAHPHPMWGGGSGWGRSRTGPWRGFGGGGMGVCPGGVGFWGSWGVAGQGESSALPHGQGRRNRGRVIGHFSAL